MVHLVYRFAGKRPGDPTDWCISCTVLRENVSGTRLIGAPRAPFYWETSWKPGGSVHLVHHYGGDQPKEWRKWCILYTISCRILHEPENNGARSAPFPLSRCGKDSETVHLVRHSGCEDAEKRKTWCT